MISEILPTLSCQHLQLVCCTGGECMRSGCTAQPSPTRLYNEGRFEAATCTKCKICVGLLFFFLAGGLFFNKVDMWGSTKR